MLLLENKIEPREFEDPIGFVKQFMDWAASQLAAGEHSQGLCKMEGFSGKKGRARELQQKERKVHFGGRRPFGGQGEKN